jgi:hypothetical protein
MPNAMRVVPIKRSIHLLTGVSSHQRHVCPRHDHDQGGNGDERPELRGHRIYLLPAVFISMGSTIFFYVFLRSTYIPKVMSAWGIVASLCYAALWFARLIVPESPAIVVYLGSLPILIAELSTGFSLLKRESRRRV